MSIFSTRYKYQLLSFELTDKFSAWFEQDGGVFEKPIHAIGLASITEVKMLKSTGETHSKKEIGSCLVGVSLDEDGADICEESENFLCVLPKGRMPDGLTVLPLSFSEECDALLANLQSVIDSQAKRTPNEMQQLADRLHSIASVVSKMELTEIQP